MIKFTVALHEAVRLVRGGVPEAEARRQVVERHGLKAQQAQILKQRIAAELVARNRPRLGYRMDF